MSAATRKKKGTARYDHLLAGVERGSDDIQHWRSIKARGFSGAGKTHFGLTYFAHQAKGKDPESTLMCIIDCDFEGQRELITRDEIIPPNLRSRIMRKVCTDPEEVNDYARAFIHAMREHANEYPNGTRVMLLENEGAFYLQCRDKYSLEVHGLTEGELLLDRQKAAISQGKKTLPTYEEGQMHAYKVINKMFSDPFYRLKLACNSVGFDFISTVLLREYIENYGTPQAKKEVRAQGRPDLTDPLFDWIVDFEQRQRTKGGTLETKHIAVVRKSRECKPFRLQDPTQARFWKAVDKSGE